MQSGFVRDMMAVKVLILYIMARVESAVNLQQIYELCFQDERLSYFDVCTAIPEMVTTGHLQQQGDTYEITQKGRETQELTAEEVMYSLRCRVDDAVADFNRRVRRSSRVTTEIDERASGEIAVRLLLHDPTGELMRLELIAPDHHQAKRLQTSLEEKSELLYDLVMTALLDDET